MTDVKSPTGLKHQMEDGLSRHDLMTQTFTEWCEIHGFDPETRTYQWRREQEIFEGLRMVFG